MTAAHVIYIPVTILLGLIAGYIMGARSARQEFERKREQSRR
jgi:uncharacterized protein YneF (UPF0154 family)